TFRLSLIHNLETQAQIVGENSISSLTFNDPLSAKLTLQGLSRSPDVVAAVLIAEDGTVFASYPASEVSSALKAHVLRARESEHHWSSGLDLLLAHRIRFEGKSLGVVYIFATLEEIGQRTRRYLLISTLILLFCMTAALLISSVSQRLVAKPIISLAETARSISRQKDYSVRAESTGDSVEMLILTRAFNDMLQQIEERDVALSHARDELEQRVQERTAELQSANRELEAFSYTVAHDLRGPLDSIGGIAFVLAHAEKDWRDAETEEMLQRLQLSTRSMAGLIDDLLNFARASTVALKHDAVNLTAMAREITRDLHGSDPERCVEFKIASLPPVQGDVGLLKIVLDNLLGNAWKYTSRHEHACIELGSMQQDGRLVYFVRDDGAGFERHRSGEIFKPFQRLHSKSEFPGTGVGLATVQRIIARHGGTVWAEGDVEKGATFYFTL
ncbi:MAG TPA: ATP-binding protein, partial [Acidobacteriaceae bacterium]|nr:ATP-binding protein [Acidobacteriaceae bacterium]